ncbi:PLDc N-terminal domain-containing protein [Lactiplantibacillus sp. DA1]|uniref:PLDc N-terminal domain-containing protein n=1 Tax=Lactiplantibacillus sp. DA1 TaxID=3079857 RepID=UPI00292A60EF|nr:PLDc N-terminal domain-containing protein [Lactiplantibacillus sp. DA1]MDV0430609.1 PLDc N-terminal domain-containing protein [Lactiplantibacillus sp. DA1]
MGLFCFHKQERRPLPPRIKHKLQQRLLPIVAMEITATTIVVADILRAKSFRRGHRLGWLLLAFVQPIGPWLYFTFGQER